MPAASVTNTFVPATLIESSEANQNFQDLVSWINTNAIQKDASVAFTGIPSGPATDPSAANQFTRKAYVDQIGIVAHQELSSNNGPFSGDTLSDMALNNVPVVAGRTYAVHFHSQVSLDNVSSTARWDVILRLNGANFRRLGVIAPTSTGSNLIRTYDWTVYWMPSVTAATDDLTVFLDETNDGMDVTLAGAAGVTRTLTLLDVGLL